MEPRQSGLQGIAMGGHGTEPAMTPEEIERAERNRLQALQRLAETRKRRAMEAAASVHSLRVGDAVAHGATGLPGMRAGCGPCLPCR